MLLKSPSKSVPSIIRLLIFICLFYYKNLLRKIPHKRVQKTEANWQQIIALYDDYSERDLYIDILHVYFSFSNSHVSYSKEIGTTSVRFFHSIINSRSSWRKNFSLKFDANNAQSLRWKIQFDRRKKKTIWQHCYLLNDLKCYTSPQTSRIRCSNSRTHPIIKTNKSKKRTMLMKKKKMKMYRRFAYNEIFLQNFHIRW